MYHTPRPLVSIPIWKRGFFCRVWPTLQTYPGENGQRKRIFSKLLYRVKIFENTVLLFSWGWMKTVTSWYRIPAGAWYHWMHILPRKMVPFSVTFAFSCVRAKNIYLKKQRVDADLFFWKRRKNLQFQRKGPNVAWSRAFKPGCEGDFFTFASL